jgi:hypothetical protein
MTSGVRRAAREWSRRTEASFSSCMALWACKCDTCVENRQNERDRVQKGRSIGGGFRHHPIV